MAGDTSYGGTKAFSLVSNKSRRLETKLKWLSKVNSVMKHFFCGGS